MRRAGWLLLLVTSSAACGGGTKAPCGPSNCEGCCASDGACKLGTSPQACGDRGGACDACMTGQMCQSGNCVSGTGGGSAGTGGGSAGTGGGNAGTGGGSAGTGGGSAGTGGGSAGTGGGNAGTGGGSAGTGGGSAGTGGGSAGTGGGNAGTGGGNAGTGGGNAGGAPDGGVCSALNCPFGCCMNGQCVGGSSNSACGNFGSQCAVCGSNQACANGQCLNNTGPCGPSTCAGCCQNGICLPGGDMGACGASGGACSVCIGLCLAGTCFSLFPGGDGGTGAPCRFNSDCASGGFLDQAECISEQREDGGLSGWPAGYCSSSCLLGQCPGNGVCTTDNYCYSSCPAPDQGRSTCRVGYVCQRLTQADGGAIQGQGICGPDCRNAGARCPAGKSCAASGYCLP